ncbi:hypothetical protein MRY87_01795 [bacterium]|nr:hypothetical protein [bacterium]
MKSNHLTAGQFVEIKEDVNAIPAGVYRLRLIEDGSYQFAVGRGNSACFMLFGDVKHLLRPLSHKEGKKRKTALKDFVDRYYDLLERGKKCSAISAPAMPFTCAFLSPEYAREVN